MKKEEIKILLVDDEPDIIEIIQFNLNSEDIKYLLLMTG